jgi:tetratricopeptide (TPR) repeat protein
MPSFFRRIARNKFLILLVISMAAILAGMYFLNDIVLSIRMIELEGFLKAINREASQVDELGMVSKYKLHLSLYNEEIDEKKFDEEELETVYLATSFEVQSKTSTLKYSGVSEGIMWIINLLRMPLGKPPIQTAIDNPTDTELTLAYYFERNKNFRRALDIYKQALDGKIIAENKIPIVLLHEGYCQSLIGNYTDAKSVFISIIKDYNDENIAITAALMLRYLETIQSEVSKVRESGDSGVVKSEKLYRLIAYNDAIEVLQKIVPQNKKEELQISFLNARCLEETGKSEESVKLYQGIVLGDSGSDAAKMANRRLLIMASVDDEGENIKELAKKNNELIKDEEFDRMIETSDKVDANRDQLAPVYKSRITAQIEEDIKESDSNQSAGSLRGNEETRLDEFIDNSIRSIDEKTGHNPVSETTQPEPSPKQSEAPIITPTPAISAAPAPVATPVPAFIPTTESIVPATPESIKTATPDITSSPSAAPTMEPSPNPATSPTSIPTPEVLPTPNASPTTEPTNEPTPVQTPTITPGITPAPEPTMFVTPAPSAEPGKPFSRNFKDEKGNIYKTEMYDANGALEKTIVYEFDEDGNPIGIKVYDKNGNLMDN